MKLNPFNRAPEQAATVKLRVFAVRDAKVENFLKPFFAETTAAGLRVWNGAVANPESGFSAHPEDYMLFELGTYEPATGKLESLLQPHPLTSALEEMPKPRFDMTAQQAAQSFSKQ